MIRADANGSNMVWAILENKVRIYIVLKIVKIMDYCLLQIYLFAVSLFYVCNFC
jgi:hypothetical protein